MSLLQAGVDTTVIALWLGHADIRSTQPYLHADLTWTCPETTDNNTMRRGRPPLPDNLHIRPA